MSQERYANVKKGITHGSIFHADDVFSAALLRKLFPEITFERVIKVPEEIDDETIVFDIGMGEFDHHQKDNEVRPDGTPYAAFGKLWREFGRRICKSDIAWEEIEKNLVEPLDHTDNTGDQNPLSLAIKNMIPAWDSENQSMDTAFYQALDTIAVPVLDAAISNALAIERAQEAVREEGTLHYNGRVLELPRYIPWEKEVITNMKDVNFVVFPSLRGGYTVMTVPVEEGSTEKRCLFPERWLGNPDKSLGMTFCHPGNFIAATDTLENALNVAEIASVEYAYESFLKLQSVRKQADVNYYNNEDDYEFEFNYIKQDPNHIYGLLDYRYGN